ncbi:MAG: hypothetical protein EZS28_038378 [Streblomastix strix]|uniref:Uncharacterized protein n=1 Tax=Streblomastix strix TaxID=222440 RepID=A0A5J4U8S0_9EUKA|nr:MAG: hypothetical protein EZS28_038378 [Streblomastix strix]
MTAGGSELETNQDIWNILFNFSDFISDLREGRSQKKLNPDVPIFPSQPKLILQINDQIEEEGGQEEIDSNLFNRSMGKVRRESQSAKDTIINYYQDMQNRPIWMRQI